MLTIIDQLGIIPASRGFLNGLIQFRFHQPGTDIAEPAWVNGFASSVGIDCLGFHNIVLSRCTLYASHISLTSQQLSHKAFKLKVTTLFHLQEPVTALYFIVSQESLYRLCGVAYQMHN